MVKLRILIIDDTASMRLLIKHYLLRNEAVILVGEASDSEEGLRKAQQSKPDVVLLDMRLQSESGIEIARKIKSLLPNSYVYLCSAYDLNEYRELKLDSLVDGFIQKSSMKPELEAMIRKELERKKIGDTQF